MENESNIPDKWFYFPIISLFIYFIIRLIDYSQIMWTFPLDYTNDIPAYLAFLHWLKVYGYHGFVPNWFNGIILFDVYPPGWAFFAYPLYLLIGNILVTAYVSILLKFSIGAVIFYFLGRSMGLSKIKTLAFYLLFFASPMAIGDFLKQGRVTEMLAWLFFISLAGITLYFRDKSLNWKFLFCGPLFAGLVLTHQVETILMIFPVLGLILTRNRLKELAIIGITFLSGLFLSAFWWIPFLKRSLETTVLYYGAEYGRWMLNFRGGFQLANITLIILPLFFLFLFCIYLKTNAVNKREEIKFFLPMIVVSILVILRLNLFIPILKNVYPDPYLLLFLLFSLYLMFIIKWGRLSIPRNSIGLILTLIPVIFITVSIIHTSFFVKPGPAGNELMNDILPEVGGDYAMFMKNLSLVQTDAFPGAVESYAAIYLNLNSSQGFAYIQAEPQYWNEVGNIGRAFTKEDCEWMVESMKKTGTQEVITEIEDCYVFEKCGLDKKVKKDYFCLYRLE